MKNREKMLLAAAISIAAVILASAIGSVSIRLPDYLNILNHQLLGGTLKDSIAPNNVAILWNIRLPRVLMCFLVGAALAASGVVMQSVLRNPLASSFTLGVSSGASLGAAFVILLNFL